MPWARFDDRFPSNRKISLLSDRAFRLYVSAVCWSAENLTDGLIRDEELTRIARVRNINGARNELESRGLWDRVEGGWCIHDYHEYNPSRDQVLAERKKNAARQEAFRQRKNARQPPTDEEDFESSNAGSNGVTNGVTNGGSNGAPTRPDLITTSSVEEAGAEDQQAPVRADVERVCRHLADRIEANGTPRPTITVKWRTEARLLMDKDKRTVEQIIRAIDWCQNDTFWKANVLSMPTLRKKYDQLRLKAQAEQQGGRAARPTGDPSTEWMRS